MSRQRGRPMRGVVAVAHRCPCGEPDVVRTAPRLPDGTPFPTSFYATCPRLTGALSTLESQGLMREMQGGSARTRSWPPPTARRTRTTCAGAPSSARWRRSRGSRPAACRTGSSACTCSPPTRSVSARASTRSATRRSRCSGRGGSRRAVRSRRPRRGVSGVSVRVGAVDCGTNSIRLLVADVDPSGALTDVVRSVEVVRWATASTAPVGSTRRRWSAPSRRAGSTPTRAPSTGSRPSGSSRRRRRGTPRNAAEFVAGVREAFRRWDVAPEVVSGAEEAALSFRGATGDLRAAGVAAPYLVVDLGGGSTELARGTDNRRGRAVGRRRQRAAARAAPGRRPADRRAGRGGPGRRRRRARRRRRGRGPRAVRTLVGLAGSVTTITAHRLRLRSYDAAAVHLATCSPEQARAASLELLHATRAERAALPYVHPGRVDVIGAGALVWERVVARVEARSASYRRAEPLLVVTSEHDILDGIALTAASGSEPTDPNRMRGRPRTR